MCPLLNRPCHGRLDVEQTGGGRQDPARHGRVGCMSCFAFSLFALRAPRPWMAGSGLPSCFRNGVVDALINHGYKYGRKPTAGNSCRSTQCGRRGAGFCRHVCGIGLLIVVNFGYHEPCCGGCQPSARQCPLSAGCPSIALLDRCRIMARRLVSPVIPFGPSGGLLRSISLRDVGDTTANPA